MAWDSRGASSCFSFVIGHFFRQFLFKPPLAAMWVPFQPLLAFDLSISGNVGIRMSETIPKRHHQFDSCYLQSFSRKWVVPMTLSYTHIARCFWAEVARAFVLLCPGPFHRPSVSSFHPVSSQRSRLLVQKWLPDSEWASEIQDFNQNDYHRWFVS